MEEDGRTHAWQRWGPYLAERQWGTVREDYSAGGDAWDDFSFDMARSRTYRWGEDGLAGLCDHRQRLCLGLALWNGQDPFLKERLFGLTNSDGNHGEDVKELYWYLDATPSHSYLKMLYKYPQRAFPYSALVDGSRARSAHEPELELLDTGIFDDDRYFDVFVEYARPEPEDLFVRITIENRGPEPAVLHVLLQVWFRNTWSWKHGTMRPELRALTEERVYVDHPSLGESNLYVQDADALLFTENETNAPALWGTGDPEGYYKDAFHRRVCEGVEEAVNPQQLGTKLAPWWRREVRPGEPLVLRMRLSKRERTLPFEDFDAVVEARRHEADDFYAHVQRGITDADERSVQRQAFAGLIWTKQFYCYDVKSWLKGDPTQPPPPEERRHRRNHEWTHLDNADVISMPDKWEYPWYAAWDLAFHCIPFAVIDPEFAKQQLVLLTREWYMHPNGQLPAYEWGFDDVNPPVHAWATWRVFQIDRRQRGGSGDLAFLERVFHKLMLNFTWWVNRKDAEGRNIFQGGFLGLDNIGVFDRSKALPTGGWLNQADGTSWMAMYSLNLMRIALELAKHNPVYEDIASKFFEHFLHIAEAMTNMADEGLGLWDDKDKFYYDVLMMPDGQHVTMKLRSMVGLIPLFAVEVLEPEMMERVPGFHERMQWFFTNRPELTALVSRWNEPGRGERRLLSLLRGHRMKRLLARLLDETEFLSDYGVRALSKHHEAQPYVFEHGWDRFEVRYEPGESSSGLFGGNSNWRGPIWFPVNYLIIEALQKFHHYYGDEFKVECPTGSGRYLSILEVADELGHRLTRLFLRGDDGVRPAMRGHPKLAHDPHFRDHVLFYEYFHGDDGRGLGASHQTGWTALVAKLLKPRKKVH